MNGRNTRAIVKMQRNAELHCWLLHSFCGDTRAYCLAEGALCISFYLPPSRSWSVRVDSAVTSCIAHSALWSLVNSIAAYCPSSGSQLPGSVTRVAGISTGAAFARFDMLQSCYGPSLNSSPSSGVPTRKLTHCDWACEPRSSTRMTKLLTYNDDFPLYTNPAKYHITMSFHNSSWP